MVGGVVSGFFCISFTCVSEKDSIRVVYRGKIYVGNERITLQRSDIISFDHNSFHIVYLRKGSTVRRTCPKLHVITQAVLIKACGFKVSFFKKTKYYL